MNRRLAYLRVGLALCVAALTACGAVERASNDESTSSSKTATAEERSAANSADEGDDSSDESEPPLDPSLAYPSAKKDAGAARAAFDAATAPTGESASASTPLPPRPEREPVSPFVDTSKDPFSTFGADVDTASYDYLRQSLLAHTLPAPSYVRVEDYINYFDYDYPVPAADAAQPFAIALAAGPHPAGRSTTLLRVGIQAKAAPAVTARAANLVFLVDVSGSMASSDKLPLVKRVLTEALDVLALTDKVSIVSYAADTRVRLAPTPVSSRAELEQAIAGLEAGGGTNGASGIELAYQQASAGFIAGGINHVVLCTDGDFNLGITSDEALVQLIRQKRDSGVTLTALGFGRGNLNDAMMEKVSNAGNGSYSIVYSEDQAVEYANERLLSTIVHVAKDMKLQVEFNPTHVKAYRLLGYEDRAVADNDFRNDRVDGGEVGAEHRVTALYELVLANGALPVVANAPPLSMGEVSELVREVDPSELVRVKVRSKPVTATDADPASEVSVALKPAEIAATADADLVWAASVATVAEVLRKSPYAAASELATIAPLVEAQRARDADRGEFATLLTQIRALLVP